MGRFKGVLVASGPTFSISTLTTLDNWRDVSRFRRVVVTLANPDSNSDQVSLIVDPSQGGTKPNIGRRQTAVAQPGEECSVEISGDAYRKLRVLAQTDSPSYPTAAGVTFEIAVDPGDML